MVQGARREGRHRSRLLERRVLHHDEGPRRRAVAGSYDLYGRFLRQRAAQLVLYLRRQLLPDRKVELRVVYLRPSCRSVRHQLRGLERLVERVLRVPRRGRPGRGRKRRGRQLQLRGLVYGRESEYAASCRNSAHPQLLRDGNDDGLCGLVCGPRGRVVRGVVRHRLL